MHQRQLCSLFILGALVLQGCATTPTLGDKMSNHGRSAEDLGDQWNTGDSMFRKGEKLRVEADKLASRSESKRREANRLMESGHQLKEASQANFQRQFGAFENEGGL